MAVVVGRSFDELKEKVRGFNSELKNSQTETKALDKALKLDPSNVEAVRQKYETFGTQLELNRQKADALQQQITNLNTEFVNGAISQESYDRQLKALEKQARNTEIQILGLEGAVTKTDKAMAQAQFGEMSKNIGNAQRAFMALSGAIHGTLDLINNWKDMSWFERILKSISVGFMVAAAAATAFKAATNPLAIAGIVAAVGVGIAAIAAAASSIGADIGGEPSTAGVTAAASNNYNLPTATAPTSREVNVVLAVEATGDTAISQENAQMVGNATAAEVNRLLGGLI